MTATLAAAKSLHHPPSSPRLSAPDTSLRGLRKRRVESRADGLAATYRLDARDDDGANAAPLWQGAWVGWLTCQAVLLMLVESTDLASDPRIALVTRALLLTGFVAAFRKPCFVTRAQRNAFTVCVLGTEVGIAACSDRLANTTGWPLWTAIGVSLLLLTMSLDTGSKRAAEPSLR